jgi:hypothetical protein
MDSSSVEQGLDFAFRPLEESFRDTIGWLHAAGHITAKQAGRAA